MSKILTDKTVENLKEWAEAGYDLTSENSLLLIFSLRQARQEGELLRTNIREMIIIRDRKDGVIATLKQERDALTNDYKRSTR